MLWEILCIKAELNDIILSIDIYQQQEINQVQLERIVGTKSRNNNNNNEKRSVI